MIPTVDNLRFLNKRPDLWALVVPLVLNRLQVEEDKAHEDTKFRHYSKYIDVEIRIDNTIMCIVAIYTFINDKCDEIVLSFKNDNRSFTNTRLDVQEAVELIINKVVRQFKISTLSD